MAKPKSPLISLGARGTIGDSLTFQKRNRATMARSKPTPAYRYTLPQAYQRWLYQDYAYLWTQQSEATKRQYAASGSRFHLTGFQYWMKYNLANLPDIAGMWHLDRITNSLVIDFSKNLNHGTVYGASIVDGIIDKALSFDGLDDYVNCGNHASIDILPPYTLDLWVKPLSFPTFATLLGKRTASSANYTIRFNSNTAISFIFADGIVFWGFTWLWSLQIQWLHIALTFDTAGNIYLYVNGSQQALKTTTHTPVKAPTNLGLGSFTGDSAQESFHGPLDQVTIYNRILDAIEIKRHSERRYPP